jgi:hypothetical protein
MKQPRMNRKQRAALDSVIMGPRHNGKRANCYRDSALYAEEHGWTLIHGTFANPDGSVIRHAWAVSPDGMTVFDGQGGTRLAPLYYRQVASVRSVWLPGEIAEQMVARMVWDEWFRHESETEPSPVPPHLWGYEPWVTPELMAQFEQLRARVPLTVLS